MIRVLHFAGILNRFDIIDTVLVRLDRSRFEVSALVGAPPRRAAPFAAGEEYATRVAGFEFTRRNYARMYAELRREIRRFRPHVLQAHHFDENVVASVAYRLSDVPAYVIGRHYSDHIYYLTRGLKQKAFLAAEAFCNRTATRIAVPSRMVADLLVERQGVPREKVALIPFGFDFGECRPSAPDAPARLRHRLGLDGKYMILTACRLNAEKGLDHLLRALPLVRERERDFHLVMLGNGPYEDELRRETARLNLDEVVTFAGWRDDALDFIAAADLVVQPSFCESYCQTLVEALAFEKPVVMTPVGAAPDVLGANERGRIVPMGDSRALAAAIGELMADRELGRRLGGLGRAYAREQLAADRAARRYEELYEAVVREKGAVTR